MAVYYHVKDRVKEAARREIASQGPLTKAEKEAIVEKHLRRELARTGHPVTESSLFLPDSASFRRTVRHILDEL
ncbi:MAG: hypothetical protein ACFFCO_12880 [Promethearchaeota archaeon]